MARYASGTKVEVPTSQAQIGRNLRKLGVGASDVVFGWQPLIRGEIRFVWRGRRYRFALDDPLIACYESGKQRPKADRPAAQEAEERRIWRALEMITRMIADLVGMDGLDAEQLLLAYVELPTGETIGESIDHLLTMSNLPALPAPKDA